MYQMFKRLEFKDNWYALLNSFAKRKIDFLTSVADEDSLNKYLSINQKKLKPSEDLINYKLLKKISKTKKKIILSTGMADDSEIKAALVI